MYLFSVSTQENSLFIQLGSRAEIHPQKERVWTLSPMSRYVFTTAYLGVNLLCTVPRTYKKLSL